MTKTRRGFFVVMALALALAAALAHASVLGHGLFGDGLVFVQEAVTTGAGQLSPYRAFSAEDEPGYWLKQWEYIRTLKPFGGKVEQYLPPVGQAAMLIQARVFGGWSGGYHLVSLLIHIANAWLLGWIVWRLSERRWPALLTALVFAMHPALCGTVGLVEGQPQLLALLFTLLAWRRVLRYPMGAVWPVLLLGALAVFSDAGALMLIGLVWGARREAELDAPSRERFTRVLTGLFIVAGVFLGVRLFLPIDSGSHGLASWYTKMQMARLLEPFGSLAGDLGAWLIVLPPKALLLAPMLIGLSGFLGFLLIVGGLYSAIRRQSPLARAGLAGFVLAEMAIMGKPTGFTDHALPALALALLSADLLIWATQAGGRLRPLAIGAFALLFLYFFPAAQAHSRGVHHLFGAYSQTGEALSQELCAALGDAPFGSRVYLMNQWSGAPMMDRRVALACGRPDIRTRILSMHPSPLPYGMSLPPYPEFDWLAALSRNPLNDVKLEIAPAGPRTLLVGLPRGTFLGSVADLDAEFRPILPPLNRWLKADGFKLRQARTLMGAPTAFSFRLPHDINDPQVYYFTYEQGRYKRWTPSATDETR